MGVLELANRAAEYLRSYCTLGQLAQSLPSSGFCIFPFPPMQIDLAIDGADEVDADLNLIKGGGWVWWGLLC